jgi:hypothetical protein
MQEKSNLNALVLWLLNTVSWADEACVPGSPFLREAALADDGDGHPAQPPNHSKRFCTRNFWRFKSIHPAVSPPTDLRSQFPGAAPAPNENALF